MGTHVRTTLSACLLLVCPVAMAQGTSDATQPTQSMESPQVAPEPPPEPSLVRRYAVGPRFIIAPGIFIPTSGNAGFTLGVIGGYGFDLGPVILTPAVMGQGSWSGDWSVYTGLGGLRLTLPFGRFGPYVEGGIGYGHVGGPFDYSSGGLALRAGAGFILFFSPSFALGLGVTYDTIVDTPYKSWGIAPLILLAF